jgi:hypothetical protein
MAKSHIDDIKNLVALLTRDNCDRGTAFLITSSLAVTCTHCVCDNDESWDGKYDEDVHLEFKDLIVKNKRKEVSIKIKAKVLRIDETMERRGLALLQLYEEDSRQISLLARETAKSGDIWESFAYPQMKEEDGKKLTGEIEEADGRFIDETGYIKLQCREAESKEIMDGASGGPIVVNGCIVGVLANQPRNKIDDTPSYAELVGLPINIVNEWLHEIEQQTELTVKQGQKDMWQNNITAVHGLPIIIESTGQTKVGIRIECKDAIFNRIDRVEYQVKEKNYPVEKSGRKFLATVTLDSGQKIEDIEAKVYLKENPDEGSSVSIRNRSRKNFQFSE